MIFFSKIFKKNRKKIDTRRLVQRRTAVRLYVRIKKTFVFCLLSFVFFISLPT